MCPTRLIFLPIQHETNRMKNSLTNMEHNLISYLNRVLSRMKSNPMIPFIVDVGLLWRIPSGNPSPSGYCTGRSGLFQRLTRRKLEAADYHKSLQSFQASYSCTRL